MANIIPEAVANLRLIGAFKGFATNLIDCISVSKANPTYVVDDDKTNVSRLATAEEIEAGGFTGHNPEQKSLYLLAIDNKLISNRAGGIADCALFCKENFTIVEFKTNAEGRTAKSIEDTYEKAISQIKNTITLFSDCLRQVGIDFVNHIDVTPHIVVSPIFPRANAKEQNYMLQFFNDTGLPLSFDDSRTF